MKFLDQKIRLNIDRIASTICVSSQRITDVFYMETGYKEKQGIPETGWEPYDINTILTELDKHYWFKFNVHTPSVKNGQSLYFKLRSGVENQDCAKNPQGIVYINGEMVQALDTNHTTVKLQPDCDIEFVCYYYTGTDIGSTKFIPDLIVLDDFIEELFYDLKVPFEAAKILPAGKDKTEIFKHLEIAVNMIHFYDTKSPEYYDSLKKAKKYFNTEFYGKVCGKQELIVKCIGHTHIDIAWLWTYAQTKEKVQRSFSTVLNLMKQYPEYKFTSSQAVLYKYIKDYAPELFEEIKKRVKEGRWEVEGAMWLECDCNLTSGESMVRQILKGKTFMKDEFGVDSEILWLPDTFGYSAAMPQILKKSGVDYFVTSKISWNDENRIPHDTFMWKGIDGTEIFTNFLTSQNFCGYNYAETTTTYVGRMNPSQILGGYARYQDKEFNDITCMTYGYGDGGGGPNSEFLEYQRRMSKGLPGIPKTEPSFAKDYLKEVEAKFFENVKLLGRMPKWVGELYLEFHRGTYTSIGKNKRNNRKSEFAVNKSEFLASVADMYGFSKYPRKKIDNAWEYILLNQFHDVLPGSSIEEVYNDSDKQYAEVFENCKDVTDSSVNAIAKNVKSNGGLLVFNSTPSTQDGAIVYDGKTYEIEKVPAHGWKVVEFKDLVGCSAKATAKTLENRFYKIVFDKDANIISFYDKRFDRDIVKPGQKFNEIKVFEDQNFRYGNWEINEFHKSKHWSLGKLISMEPVQDGTRVGMKIKREYCKSTFEQTVWVYSLLDRVDFETHFDWHEHHQLVKALFPINVHASKAVYDIQFGNVERPTHSNTSWDQAKFEVCAHKWADVSDRSYGVSIMNDCKYGYSCTDTDMALTLLKCSTDPNPNADQGEHIMTYSVLPHGQDFRERTIPSAYMLNQPLDCVKVEKQDGTLPATFSLVNTVSDNAVIESIKKCEDDSAYIIRMYEAFDYNVNVKLDFGVDVKKLVACNLMEEELREIPVVNNSAVINLKNYEILTLKAYV